MRDEASTSRWPTSPDGATEVPRGQRVPTAAMLVASGVAIAGALALAREPWPPVVGVGTSFVVGASFVFAWRRR